MSTAIVQITASMEELHQRNLKAGEAAKREEETRKRAAEQGLPVGQVRMGTADLTKAHEAMRAHRNSTDPGHEARKRSAETAIVPSEKAKEQSVWV